MTAEEEKYAELQDSKAELQALQEKIQELQEALRLASFFMLVN